MTALFDFAADIVRAHAEALKSSEQGPTAGAVVREPSVAADLTSKQPPCSVIVLDDRRRR